MLVINPDECIDCGVCEPECPEDDEDDFEDDTRTGVGPLSFLSFAMLRSSGSKAPSFHRPRIASPLERYRVP